jgi:C1A family cysteine protease
MIKFQRVYAGKGVLREKMENYLSNLNNHLNSGNKPFITKVYGSKFFDFSHDEIQNIKNGFQQLTKESTTSSAFELITAKSLLENLDNLQYGHALTSVGHRANNFNEDSRNKLDITLTKKQLRYYTKLSRSVAKAIEKLNKMIKFKQIKHRNNDLSNGDSASIQLSEEFLPKAIDFRSAGIVTEKIYDQGEFGASWVFSFAGMMESRHAFHDKIKPTSLSRQQLLDCVSPGSSEGGNPLYAMKYAISHRLIMEKTYGDYTGMKGECRVTEDNKGVQINSASNFKIHKRVTVPELKYLLLGGPLSVALDAKRSDFVFYSSGILKYECVVPNHSVYLVGYGEDMHKTKFWIIRNSWGKDWGINGEALILMNENFDGCGITSNVLEFVS